MYYFLAKRFYQLFTEAVIVFTYYIILSGIGKYVHMMRSVYSLDNYVTKRRPVARTPFKKSNRLRSIVRDNYSLTRTRSDFASLIMSIENLNPPLFWCNLSNSSKDSMYELLRVEECVLISMLKIRDLIRQQVVKEKMTITLRKHQWISFIDE